MASLDPLAQPFAVEDAGGSVPVTEVAYDMTATVVLKLGRALQGRGVVHGAARSDPAAVPFDMGRMVPMLAFHGVAIG
jgi:hypothetical protein